MFPVVPSCSRNNWSIDVQLFPALPTHTTCVGGCGNNCDSALRNSKKSTSTTLVVPVVPSCSELFPEQLEYRCPAVPSTPHPHYVCGWVREQLRLGPPEQQKKHVNDTSCSRCSQLFRVVPGTTGVSMSSCSQHSPPTLRVWVGAGTTATRPSGTAKKARQRH